MDYNRATYHQVFDLVIFSLSFSIPFLNHYLQNAVNRVPSNWIANTLHKPARINGAYGPCLTLGFVYSRSVPVRKGTERIDEQEKC